MFTPRQVITAAPSPAHQRSQIEDAIGAYINNTSLWA